MAAIGVMGFDPDTTESEIREALAEHGVPIKEITIQPADDPDRARSVRDSGAKRHHVLALRLGQHRQLVVPDRRGRSRVRKRPRHPVTDDDNDAPA